MISDSLKFCGMGDGEYVVGGNTIYVRNGWCRLEDGTISGSSKSLFDGAKNLFKMGIAPENIAVMAAVNPAKAAGCTNRGELVQGYRADILIIDKDLNLTAVFSGGKLVRCLEKI